MTWPKSAVATRRPSVFRRFGKVSTRRLQPECVPQVVAEIARQIVLSGSVRRVDVGSLSRVSQLLWLPP